MKIISWNVNGLRAVYKRNFAAQLERIDADIVCLQEIKIDEGGLSSGLFSAHPFEIPGYNTYFNPAAKKGYSGVAVYAKDKPIVAQNRLGIERFDGEGRILELQYPDFTVINIYVPHGGRKKENLEYKLDVYGKLFRHLKNVDGKPTILAGDLNVAHKEADLARPKENINNTMFTAEERKQIDKLIGLDFVDSFRKFHQEGGRYTWWPYRNDARERNLGWRIDYIFVSGSLAKNLTDAFMLADVNGSDHCPIGIELKI